MHAPPDTRSPQPPTTANIGDLVERLADAGIFLAVQDGKLVCKAAAGALTDERRALIAGRKAELIAYLATPERGDATASEPPLQARSTREAPLSPTQQRIWFIDRLTESGANYAIPVTWRLDGPLDAELLARALHRVVERHESLRSVIGMRGDDPVSVPREADAFAMQRSDLAHLPPQTRDAEVRRLLQASLLEPFRLDADLPIRARLLRLDADRHVLMLTLHHIASDGWSVENLLREVSALYVAFAAGAPDPLPPLALQYGDYAAWQQTWLQGERLQAQMRHWREALDGAPLAHALPLDQPRPTRPLQSGASWRQRLPASLRIALANLGRHHGATLFMTLQAAFAVLLSRWSGERDIVIGTPVANRPREDLSPLMGFFSNTLALRNDLSGDPDFVEVLRRARAVALDAYAHQNLPFELLVEALNPPRSLSMAPVVQIMFSLADIDEGAALALPGVRIEAVLPDSVNAKFDLHLSLSETPDGLDACWDYSPELFDGDTVARMGAAFATLLAAIVETPHTPIRDLPLLDDAQLAHVLRLADGGETAHSETLCLHALFERRAADAPDAIALTFEGASFDYRTIDAAANRLARHLRGLGAGPGTRVAIVAERGPELLVGILAILKSGSAYVPMDPDVPAHRLRHVLSDCRPIAVLACTEDDAALDAALAAIATDDGIEHRPVRIDLHRDAARWADADASGLSVDGNGPAATDPACILYTSGSTGLPKGAILPHRAVVNRMLAMQAICPHGPDDRVLQKTPIGFDVALREIFLTLLAGARLVAARAGGHKDPGYLVDLIREQRITVVGFVPSMLQAFLEHPRAGDCDSVRRILSGGETLPGALIDRCRERLPQARLLNLYGPAETAVSVTHWHAPEGPAPDVVPIGRPGDNVRVYVLDDAGRPVPRGMRGELHIAGRQVALGYLDRPELTAERFLPDPYRTGPDARMYRSGDLGRQRADGTLEFLGRNDVQVKIRGQRIEPGEVEAQLAACADVANAAVVARDDGAGGRRLVAYVVSRAAGDDASILAALQRQLQARLPAYMVPSAWVRLPQLPVTVNGKLDLAALPDPSTDAARAFDATPAESMHEHALVAIWRELLQAERIGVLANFFDLGGHSLLLTRLQNRIAAEFGIDPGLNRLFAAQTVREQARLLDTLQATPDDARLPAPAPRPADAAPVLSFAQQRLWFIDQMGGAGAVYNIPCALRLRGVLHAEALRAALQTIVDRHEILRTVLPAIDGEAVPRLRDECHVPLPGVDMRALAPEARERALKHRIDAEAARPFDLGRDPMLRAQLLRIADDEHVLLLTVHHIAADGWSMGVLLRELAEGYEAARDARAPTLAPLPLQYADYAHWQQQWLRGERLEAQAQYWQRQLADLPAVHNLPLDAPRPETQRYRGAVHWQHLPHTLLDGLQRLGRRHDATLFMTLQAAFAVLLSRWSGDTDLAIGTPIANRRHESLAPLIGFFVNTLVLRNDLSGDPDFIEVLARTRRVALDAYEHQDLPFERLVDLLRPQRTMGHSPLFQVMLALENDSGALRPFGGLEVSDAATDSQHAKFEITLNLRETANGLDACWDYNRDLFRAETIARMAEAFAILLAGIVATPDRPVRRLRLSPPGAALPAHAIGPHRPLSTPGIHHRFEAQAAAAPERIAIRDRDRAIDYRTLDRRANALAHVLRAHGVARDVVVALHAERGIGLIIGMLATLKAGGAYLPLDPAHPRDRLQAMLADSGARVLLTEAALPALEVAGTTCVLDLDDPHRANGNEDPPAIDFDPSQLLYVLYTSGSTGTPKGAMLEHRNLANTLDDALARFHDDVPAQASLWASQSFDASALEIHAALCAGATLHIVPDAIRADTDAWLAWIVAHGITQAYLPPHVVRRLDELDDATIAALPLRRVVVGVEPLSERGLFRLRRLLPSLRLFNGYGPTEATIYCSAYDDIRDLARIAPIGRPIANTTLHILDDALQPVPEGVVGELYVGGPGVARGYLARPALTAERFVRLPDSDERCYRTGDLARWSAEGHLEFRGRGDQQIKLNGVRIEPGEIESALRALEDVRDAAVLVRDDGDARRTRLVAYVVPAPSRSPSVESLREALSRLLPPYMVPAAFVRLERLPLTVSGKLDARALPAPDLQAHTGAAHVAPEGALETMLAGLWQDLLDLPQVGATTSFFDLGGHSLNAVKLMSAIRERTGRTLPIAALFEAPTIRTLAQRIVQDEDGSHDEVVVALRRDGDEAPLFVFHAAGGDVLCYRPMLQGLSAPPVYGFHRHELAQQKVPQFLGLEQLADDYVERLLTVQPKGLYRLAGWSSGGLLAIEVAARLEARGHRVASLGLIDTMLATGNDLPPRLRALGLDGLQALDDADALAAMREFEPSLPETVSQDGRLDLAQTDYFEYLVAANQIGLDFHAPTLQLDARIRYFACALNRNFKSVEQRIEELQRLARRPIERVDFEATHFSIMEDPIATELGRAMAEFLASV
jgi:amino acid adenylation domain-containing protein